MGPCTGKIAHHKVESLTDLPHLISLYSNSSKVRWVTSEKEEESRPSSVRLADGYSSI